MRRTIPNIKKMVEVARELKMPIIHVNSRYRDERDGHGAFLRARPFARELDAEGHYSIGASEYGWEGDIVDELKPEKG